MIQFMSKSTHDSSYTNKLEHEKYTIQTVSSSWNRNHAWAERYEINALRIKATHDSNDTNKLAIHDLIIQIHI